MCKPWHGSFKITISFPEAAFLLMWRTSRPLARSNTGSPRFADYPVILRMPRVKSDWFWSQSIVFTSHSKPECRWTWPGVPISSACQKGPLGTKLLKITIKPFSSYSCLYFKTSFGAQPFIWKWLFLACSLSCKKDSFPYKGFCTTGWFKVTLQYCIAHPYCWFSVSRHSK